MENKIKMTYPMKGKSNFRIIGINGLLRKCGLEEFNVIVTDADGNIIFNEENVDEGGALVKAAYLILISSGKASKNTTFDPNCLHIKLW